jgi:putative nucleotidyltransferase with HDIG domain
MTFVGIDTRHGLDPAVESLLADFERRPPAAMPPRERRTEAIAGLAFLAVAVPLAIVGPGPDGIHAVPAALLLLAYAAIARIQFATGAGYTAPTQLVLVPLLFALPPAVVPLAIAGAMLLKNVPDYLRGHRHPDRMLLVLGDAAHALGPALVLALLGSGEPEWAQWPVYLLALVAQVAVDFFASTLRELFALGVSPSLQPRLLGWVQLVDVLLSPIGLLAAFAAVDAPWAVLLVLPLAALLGVFARERRDRLDHAQELSRAYRGTTLLLSDLLDADHQYTGAHSRDVVALALAVADEMGLDDRRRRNVEFGALLHDVGKINVPNEILNKPGPLDDDEWKLIKTHTLAGQRMLDRVGGVLHEVGDIVRSSHERWDGRGYPDGLAAESIPLEASIVACCDAVDAMTTDRSYRRAMSKDDAMRELHTHAGSQFSPTVVRVVERLLGGAEPERRVGGVGLGLG